MRIQRFIAAVMITFAYQLREGYNEKMRRCRLAAAHFQTAFSAA
jgi:hypothetical protein